MVRRGEKMIIQHEMVTVKVKDLLWDDQNPNEMTAAQKEALRASMKEFGDLQPIVIDQDKRILDGAHRADIYREEGIEETKAILIHIENDSDRRIIRQTMNKLRGRHDPQKDAEEFLAILKQNAEKKLFYTSAIKESEFYKTIGRYAKGEPEDKVPELDEENIITQKGDIWQMGPHRLMCGDSLNPQDVAKLMDGTKAHIVVTDPPYGVDYVASIAGREGTNGKWKHIKGDELKGKALQEFCEKFLQNIKNNSTEDSAYYIFFGMKTFHHLLAAMDAQGIYYALPLIWMKGRPTISWAKYHPDYEVISYGGNGAKARAFRPPKTEQKKQGVRGGAGAGNYTNSYEPIAFSGDGAKPNQPRWFAKYDQTTTWMVPPDHSANYTHPTQKPVELAERALLNSSREGEICLDLFTGPDSHSSQRTSSREYSGEWSSSQCTWTQPSRDGNTTQTRKRRS
jgi:DNA modification methylase